MTNLDNIEKQANEAEQNKEKTEEWEEVWEDDESGNLVPQIRTEVDKYQWKSNLACKNVIRSCSQTNSTDNT